VGLELQLSSVDQFLLAAARWGFWPLVGVLLAVVAAGVGWARRQRRDRDRRLSQPEWQRWVRRPNGAEG
jgi:hypothetical protein